MGEAVRGLGLRVAIPRFLVGHICSEQSFGELLGHELRWARTIRNIDPWLSTVAVRACAEVLRRRYRDAERELGQHASEPLGAIEFDAVLDSVWLDRIARDLSPGDREVLILLYLYPHRRPEVAAHLGVTQDHLRVIAFRARRHVQAVLDSIGELDPFG